MAYDIFLGDRGNRNWSRSGGPTEWAERTSAKAVLKRIPWVPVITGVGIASLIYLLPTKRQHASPLMIHDDERLAHTMRIRNESMDELAKIPSRLRRRSGR